MRYIYIYIMKTIEKTVISVVGINLINAGGGCSTNAKDIEFEGFKKSEITEENLQKIIEGIPVLQKTGIKAKDRGKIFELYVKIDDDDVLILCLKKTFYDKVDDQNLKNLCFKLEGTDFFVFMLDGKISSVEKVKGKKNVYKIDFEK